ALPAADPVAGGGGVEFRESCHAFSLSLAKLDLSVTRVTWTKVTGQVNFNSHTDSVVAMAVELVNLLTEGERRGRRYLPPAGGERAARLSALCTAAGGRGGAPQAGAAGVGPPPGPPRGALERRAPAGLRPRARAGHEAAR